VSVGDRFWDLLGSRAGAEDQPASPWARAVGTRAALTLKLDLAGTAVVQDDRQVREDGRASRAPRVEVSGGRGGRPP